MAVNPFRKTLHRGCLKGFWICLGLGICIMPGYQGSEYTSISEYTRALIMPVVLNGPGLHRVRNIYQYAQIIPEYAGIWWIFLNLSEWLCFAFSRSTPFLFERVVTYFKTRRYSLKEHEAAFWRDKFDLFVEAGSICFVFCFRLNSFTRCCYLLGTVNLDTPWHGSKRL